MPHLKPEIAPNGVRTLPAVPSCPICERLLRRRQTVCSAKCRITRSRQKREAKLRERDAKVRLFLTTVIETAQEAMQVLKEP